MWDGAGVYWVSCSVHGCLKRKIKCNFINPRWINKEVLCTDKIVGIHIFFVTVDEIYELTSFCITGQLINQITFRVLATLTAWSHRTESYWFDSRTIQLNGLCLTQKCCQYKNPVYGSYNCASNKHLNLMKNNYFGKSFREMCFYLHASESFNYKLLKWSV